MGYNSEIGHLLKKGAHLFIVRHGQTDWNAQRRIQGSVDRSLDAMGKAQAKAIGEKLSSFPISAVYSSHLKRAHETAQIIGSYHACPLYIEPALQEGSYGKAIEGLTIEEFHQQYHKELEEYRSSPSEKRQKFKYTPDSEAPADIVERVSAALHQISLQHLEQKVIVVSHGWVMRSLIVALAQYDDRTINVSNTGLIELVGDGNQLHLIDHQGISGTT